jgi:hypothetical protein
MSGDNVIVRTCGPDGLCSLCAGEDRTGNDGCGSYFQASTLPECGGWFSGEHRPGCERVVPSTDDPASARMRDLALDRAERVTGSNPAGGA